MGRIEREGGPASPTPTDAAEPSLFTLLSQQRSGTHFVASMLSSHPSVAVFGEVLHRRSSHGYLDFVATTATDDPTIADPAEAHRAWDLFIAGFRRQGVTLPGVIIMYNQLPKLPEHLARRIVSVSPVVHLVRQNVLRTHVSDFVNRNRLKPAHSQEDAFLSRIVLPVGDLVRALTVRQESIATFRARLAGRSHVEILYEEVVEHPQEEMARTLKYLGLDPRPVATSLKRSNPYPLSQIIENYDEVNQALAGTPFARMCAG